MTRDPNTIPPGLVERGRQLGWLEDWRAWAEKLGWSELHLDEFEFWMTNHAPFCRPTKVTADEMIVVSESGHSFVEKKR